MPVSDVDAVRAAAKVRQQRALGASPLSWQNDPEIDWTGIDGAAGPEAQ